MPALAVTGELLAELMAEITHTPNDTIEIVDPGRLATLALALRGLVLNLASEPASADRGRPA